MMDYTKKYILDNRLQREVFDQTNQVRIFKKMIILAELVGVRERQFTEAFYNLNDESMIKWKIRFPTVKKLSQSATRIWNQFKD